MASEFSQEEINDILARAAYEMQQFGEHSAETSKQLRDLSLGVKNYTDNLVGSFKQLGSSIGGLAKGMAEGATGAAQYTSTIQSGADIAGTALSALGPIGKAAGIAIQGLGKAAGMVGKQADAVYKGFQDLATSGTNTAAGMTGVFQNMQKLGYSVEELGNFSAIVKNSSETLASFGATAGQGLSVFSSVADDIKNSNVGFEFRNMGMSVDSINTGIAGFLKMQTLNGSRAIKTQDQLTAGAAEYVRELNILSKLTGQNNEKLQQNREEMLAQERFAGLKYELQQRIDAGDEAAKEQLKQINFTYEGLGKYGKEAQTGFINSLTGTVSEANAKFLRTLPEAYALSQEPVIDSNKIMAAAAQNATTYMENFGAAAAKIGASGDFGLAVQDLMKGITYSKMSFEERQKAAEADIVVTDKSTTSMTKLIDTQKNTTQALQNVAMAGFDLVVPAFQGIADAGLLAAEALQAITGVSPVAKSFGGGATGTGQAGVDYSSRAAVATATAADARKVADATAERAVTAIDSEAAAKTELERLKKINASKEQQAEAEKKIAESAKARVKAEEEENKAAYESRQRALEAKNARLKARREGAVAPTDPASSATPTAPAVSPKASGAPATPTAPAVSPKASSAPTTPTAPVVAPKASGEPTTPAGGATGSNTGSPVAAGAPVTPKPIKAVAQVGPGFTTVTTTDNDKQRREGVRNWRNNNPGNIEYGDFAKSFGAVGADPRFAVFPTLESGMKAKEELLFGNRSRYAGLSVTDALNRYAPPTENNTAAYIKSVTEAVGVTPDTILSQLNSSQKQSFLDAVTKVEGFKTGKVVQAATGGIVRANPEGVMVQAGEAGMNEAFVPLPDGKTIPVQIAGSNQQLDLMSAQLSKLDDMVRVMQSQLSVSERILKYAQ
jgi:hypothetical protein